MADVLAYSDLCRVVTLQVAPGYRNHIIRSGRIEGGSLCYVVLVLGLIPGLGTTSPLGKGST